MLFSTPLPKKGFIPVPQGNDPILTLRLLRRDSGLVDSLDGELVAVQQVFHSPEWGGYRLTGDGNKARSEYEMLLRRWSDADPDLPILKEAQSEFRALR